jgi:hypothetical protein
MAFQFEQDDVFCMQPRTSMADKAAQQDTEFTPESSGANESLDDDRLLSSYIEEILHERHFHQQYSTTNDSTADVEDSRSEQPQSKRPKKIRKMIAVEGRLVRSDRSGSHHCSHDGCLKVCSKHCIH